MVGALGAAVLLGAALLAGSQERAADSEVFELRIRPILANTCFRCHGGE